ncbi:MAG TPA: hypothetical protein VGN57_08480 [Pirellulaceae bacterium]|jgi:hypothetical protein|nr:hypothetical protein [Pirellulaceae bacterium]
MTKKELPLAAQQRIAGRDRQRRAVKKIEALRKLLGRDSTVDAIIAVIGLLNHGTNHRLAWPSAEKINDKLGFVRGSKSGARCVRIIREIGIFRVHHLTPADAVAYAASKYGAKLKINMKQALAPCLFEVNDHPLWNDQQALPAEVVEGMAETVRDLRRRLHNGQRSTVSEALGDHPKQADRMVPGDHARVVPGDQEGKELLSEGVAVAPLPPNEDGEQATPLSASDTPLESSASNGLASANPQPDLSGCEKTSHPPTVPASRSQLEEPEEGRDLEQRGVAVCDREGSLTRTLSANAFSGPRDEPAQQSGMKLPDSALQVIAGHSRKAKAVPVDADFRPRNETPLLAVPPTVAVKPSWDSAAILKRLREKKA